ncbi:PREDICTED: granzyme B-like [Cyprinodon variegatus]|uniref:trypsin n=1 Tax=Cyprinodon variegatus TaxID=28743 RepID=A0A3Q2DG64_CYPVA|nr:PREDICTED: granzyme B-like [Cyprinodon variegatus]
MLSHEKAAVLLLLLSSCGPVYPGKITGGHVVVPHSRPYMVLVERTMPNGDIINCGGFLLNEDFVMTAAHCKAKEYLIYLGLHDVDNKDNAERITVEQAFPHSHFNSNTYINDIMLLKLSSKANFSSNVKPINLASNDAEALPKSCSVSGWGKTEDNGYLSPLLMEINITLIKNETCKKENAYCSQGKNGPNEGDSGGPLVCEPGLAYGVVSTMLQPHANEPRLYRYARIPDYKGWIISTVKAAKAK